MRVAASLGPTADIGMSARDVVATMVSPGVSGKERAEAAKLMLRGATLVKVQKMLPYLREYPDRLAAELLESGFRDGFSIPCVLAGEFRNLSSVSFRPEVVSTKLFKEVSLGRMAAHFSVLPISDLCVSPLGLVPKKACCKVAYTSFDAALWWVRRCGSGTLLAKTDIEAAFRLLLVHPESFRWLGCFWEGQFFVDLCLPMGCSVSCAYFETFSTFLEWVISDSVGTTLFR